MNLYYASGGDYGDDHVLVLTEEDFAMLRKLQEKAKAIFSADEEGPVYVSWFRSFDVIDLDTLYQQNEDLGDALVDAHGDPIEVEASPDGIEPVRTEGELVEFFRLSPDDVGIEWRAKHVDDHEYYVSVRLTEDAS